MPSAVGSLAAPAGPLVGAPGARLFGDVELRFSRSVPSETRLFFDQGYVEDGRALFGRSLRYRLPPPQVDEEGRCTDLTAELQCEGEAPSALAVRGLPSIDEGWCVVTLTREVHADDVLRLSFTRGVQLPTVPVIVGLHVRADDAVAAGWSDGVDLHVRSAEPTWLRMLAPSAVEAGTPFDVAVLALGGWSGPRASSDVTAWSQADGALELRLGESWDAVSTTPIEWCGVQVGVRTTVTLNTPGVQRLAVRRARDAGWLRGLSTPIGVTEHGQLDERVRFGALHNHSTMGGHGGSTPGRTLAYARDVARLDFCALTEHAEAPLFDWSWLQALERSASRDEAFVAFAGFEWTHPLDGHRHVVYRRAADKQAWSGPPPARDEVPQAETLEALATAVGHDEDALVVVHHPLWFGGAAQQSYRFGEPGQLPRQRLAEVYSWHGSSFERGDPFPIHDRADHQMRGADSSILRALQAGHGFALVADGDNHLGRPGSLVGVQWQRATRFAYNGVLGVWSDDGGRDSLFEALGAGHVYGTTGARQLLDVQKVSDQLRVRVHATAPLAEVLVRTPEAVVARRQFASVPWHGGRADAPLFLDPEAGTWDFVESFDVSGHEGPLIVQTIQQDHHRGWARPRPRRP